MKKIALPIENLRIGGYFERCKEFMVYTVQGFEITHRERINNPVQSPKITDRLAKMGVTDVMALNIKPETISELNRMKINVFVGVKNEDPELLVSDYAHGIIETYDNVSFVS